MYKRNNSVDIELLNYEEFNEALKQHYETHEDDKVIYDLDYNDEILEIEEVGVESLYDIEVSDNNLFYANGILTHNSAIGNIEAGQEAVSDSAGISMFSDSMIFLLQTKDMKEHGEIMINWEKNRMTGKTVSYKIGFDYSKMRFEDKFLSNAQIGSAKDSIDIKSDGLGGFGKDLIEDPFADLLK